MLDGDVITTPVVTVTTTEYERTRVQNDRVRQIQSSPESTARRRSSQDVTRPDILLGVSQFKNIPALLLLLLLLA